MSKPVKELILADYKSRFDGVDGALLIDIRGIEANQNNALRLDLGGKDIRVTIVKNTLARKAFAGTGLEPLIPALQGPSALTWGGASVIDVARELIAWAGKVDNLEVKAAVLDGEYFEGQAGVERLSRYPTKPEAQARAVALLLAPAANLAAAMLDPGSRILAIVKEIEQRLAKGETIAKAG
ncbi:MAG: 50S ribosomal protein L10 [Planctomycetota bacterium]|jgi:large subunit ribosomal protein L10